MHGAWIAVAAGIFNAHICPFDCQRDELRLEVRLGWVRFSAKGQGQVTK